MKADIRAVNEPRLLKAIAPLRDLPGTDYHLLIVTQSSTKGNGRLLKNIREVRSEFKLTAQS